SRDPRADVVTPGHLVFALFHHSGRSIHLGSGGGVQLSTARRSQGNYVFSALCGGAVAKPSLAASAVKAAGGAASPRRAQTSSSISRRSAAPGSRSIA